MAKIRVAFMKDLMGQYSRDEISFSRMCELINEEASRDNNRDELIEKYRKLVKSMTRSDAVRDMAYIKKELALMYEIDKLENKFKG
jgi:hypothetical protein